MLTVHKRYTYAYTVHVHYTCTCTLYMYIIIVHVCYAINFHNEIIFTFDILPRNVNK